MRSFPAPRLAHLALLSATILCTCITALAQTPPAAPAPDAPQPQPPISRPLSVRPVPSTPMTPDEAEALRISKLPILNGRPYDQPSTKDTLIDYANDTYGVSGLARITIRALYSEARDAPSEWDTDFTGFSERWASQAGINIISGNVRLAMELVFHEDLRYLPCHGCSVKKKIENALLAEITARHDETGKRFFTVTPTIADFSGPIVAHATWYPSFDPWAGVVSTRLVFATRIGQHLFQEFVWERHHHDPPFGREPTKPLTPPPPN